MDEDDALPASLSLPQHFSLVHDHDKSAASRITTSAWCPTMDLLALLTTTNYLHIHRLAFDKLFSLQLTPHDSLSASQADDDWRVTALSWRPDGKAIAVGDSAGGVQLVDVETRSVVAAWLTHTAAINSVQWCKYEEQEAESSEAQSKSAVRVTDAWKRVNIADVSLPFTDRTRRFFDPMPPPPSSAAPSASPSPSPVPHAGPSTTAPSFTDVTVDGERQVRPTLLLTADVAGRVCGRMHGTLAVLDIDLSTLHNQRLNIARLSLHSAFSSLATLVTSPNSALQLSILPLPLLQSRVHELSLLAGQLQQIDRLTSYTSTCASALTSRYSAIRSSLAMRFSLLTTLLADNQLGSHTPQQQLVHLLLTAVASNPLLQFLGRVGDTASLKRQLAGLESGLMRMTDAAKAIRRAVEELSFRVAECRGMARWRDRSAVVVGVDGEVRLTAMLRLLGGVLLRVEQVGRVVICVRRGFTALFGWLVWQVATLGEEDHVERDNGKSTVWPVDDILECIQCDLYTDRIGPLLAASLFASTPPCVDEVAVAGPSVGLAGVGELPSGVGVLGGLGGRSLMELLEAFRTELDTFTASPCATISAAVLSASEQSKPSLTLLKEVGGVEGGSVEDVAICYDKQRRAHKLAYTLQHPVFPYPVLLVHSQPSPPQHHPTLLPASPPPSSVLAIVCPGLTSTSHASVAALSWYGADELLVLMRYNVSRRSSELRHLHNQHAMLGNNYSRLYLLQPHTTPHWTHVTAQGRLSVAEWVVGRVGAGGMGLVRVLGEVENGVGGGVVYRQRCLYGVCGRSVSVGKERGVCAVLLTAVQPHRTRQQMRRVILLDMVDNEEEEEVGEEQAEATEEAEEETAEEQQVTEEADQMNDANESASSVDVSMTSDA